MRSRGSFPAGALSSRSYGSSQIRASVRTSRSDLAGRIGSARQAARDGEGPGDAEQDNERQGEEKRASEDLTAILDDTGTYKAPWIP